MRKQSAILYPPLDFPVDSVLRLPESVRTLTSPSGEPPVEFAKVQIAPDLRFVCKSCALGYAHIGEFACGRVFTCTDTLRSDGLSTYLHPCTASGELL